MRLYLKIFKNKRLVHSYKTTNNNRFAQKLSLTKNIGDRFYLKVIYAKDTLNEGYYNTFRELHKAYRWFIEPALLKEVR